MRAGRKKQLKLNKGVYIITKYFGGKLHYLVRLEADLAYFSSDCKDAKKYMNKQLAELDASWVDGTMVESI
jgi:hypothetical protein